MVRLFISLLLLIVSQFPSFGQGSSGLDTLVSEIAFQADVVLNAENGGHRMRAHAELLENIDQFLDTKGSYEVSLDSIPWLYVLHGDDFRLVSWQLRHF